MLKDTVLLIFTDIYIVSNYKDLQYGINSLAAITEHKYYMNLPVPNIFFLFGRKSTPNQRSPIGKHWFSTSLQICGIRIFHIAAII